MPPSKFFVNPVLTCLTCLTFVSFLTILQAQENTGEFKPSGKVWGLGFIDLYYKSQGDTARWASRAEYSGVPEEVYAFGMRRFYLGYDYNISPKFSTSALLEGGDNFRTAGGDRTVTIKSLHLRWKSVYKGADLLIGQMSTLTFSHTSERVWSYRSVEKTITDMRGVRSSSDLGIALHGFFDADANYGYNLMVGNGASTRPEDLSTVGRHKVYYGDIYAYLMERRILLDLYGDLQTGPLDRNVMTAKGFAAYQSDAFTLGAEVFTQTFRNNKADGESANPYGLSVFAKARLVPEKLFAFARYDFFSPDENYRDQDVITVYSASLMNRHYDETFFVAGLDFAPHRNVRIIPNIWINGYSPKASAALLPERKADIVPRITFYFAYR